MAGKATTDSIQADTISNKAGTGSPSFPNGLSGDVKSDSITDTAGTGAPDFPNGISVNGSAINGEVRVTDSPGHGSINTSIRRFTNSVRNTGTSITYADSATLGASFTINEDGIYAIHYTDFRTGGLGQFGISVNSTELTTDISGITNADRLAFDLSDVDGTPDNVSVTARLSSADVIRAHTNGTPNGTGDGTVYFHIVQIAKL